MDVFSLVLFLPASYAGMGHIPHTRGGCHLRNYVRETEFPTILVSDVASSQEITMPFPATRFIRTTEIASLHATLPTFPTYRIGLARVGFFLHLYLHADSLCLVGEFVSKSATGPLVQFLIVLGANIHVLSNSSHITDCQRLHPVSVEGGNKLCRGFVLNIFDLMCDFPKLLLLRCDQFLTTTCCRLFY